MFDAIEVNEKYEIKKTYIFFTAAVISLGLRIYV